MKSSKPAAFLRLIWIPAVITAGAAILAAGTVIFLKDDSLLVPLVLCAFISSVISSLLFNKASKKLYKCIRGLVLSEPHKYRAFSINKSFSGIFSLVEEMANRYDSVKNSIKSSSEEISESFDKVNSLSEQSYSDISKIFASIDEISMPVNEQADELQKASGMINKLSEYLDIIHENYNSILNSAGQINALSEAGEKTVSNLQGKFNATFEISEDIYRAASDFAKTLENINNFVDIIGQIGKRSNLLALNASIEAARAGESGKGFAVVADEFKKLSTQSSEYSAEIGKLISDVKLRYQEIIDSVDRLKCAVKEQSTSVEDTDKAFSNIANAIASISGEMNSVAASLNNMNSDKSEALKLIMDTAELARKTVGSSEKFATVMAYHVQTVTDIFENVQKFGKLISRPEEEPAKN